MAKEDKAVALGRAFADGFDPPEELAPTARKLVDAATRVFGDKGYAGATTKAIAKEAGVSEKTLFSHFRSKSELFVATIGPGLKRMMGEQVFIELIPALVTATTARERLSALAKNRLEFTKQNTALVKAVAQELIAGGPVRDEIRAFWEANVLPRATALLESAKRNGQLREDVPVARAIRVFVSTIAGYLILRFVLMPELDWDDDAEIDGMVDVLLQGFEPRP